MTTSVRETERKYETDTGVEIPLWDPAAGVADLAGPQELVLEAVYFDTDDLRLARAGVTLRRRHGGEDAGWHLKLPAGTDTREEIQERLTAAERDTAETAGIRRPPRRFADLVRVYTRGADLGPVAELTTSRRRWRVLDEAGRRMAEMVDDRVVAHTMGRSTSSLSWREVEVELDEHGDVDLLDRLQQYLVDSGFRRSAHPSKLARVLGDRLPRPVTPPLHGDSPASAVVLGYLREQAAAMYRNDPLVRQDSPDAVHQMRVAIRRMRSALQGYGRLVDRAATRELTDELRWIAGVLGAARDLEVLRMRFADAARRLPAELVLGPVQARLERYFAGREAAARSALIEALDGDRYLALLQAIDGLLAAPPLTRRARRPARRVLPAELGRAFRRVDQHLATARDRPVGDERDVELHEARKAAKRLRYVTEAAAPALGRPARRLITRAKGLQELLGELQDGVLARPVLREIGVQAHLDGENGFTWGVLHTQEKLGSIRPAETAEAWRRLRRVARGVIR